MNDIQKILNAASYSARQHMYQRRKGETAEPYINHPIEVANLLANVGDVDDTDVIIAALLHDTVEDTETTEEELSERFGYRVAGLVMELTDDKTLPKAERKRLQVEHAPHLSDDAKLIKLADKISNIRDITENPPADWSVERRIEYIEWGESVVAGLRGSNKKLEETFDQTCAIAREKLASRRREFNT
jgi:GTP diphosphokinase / guanosine-3',5'-bis(diphosphate) 3'-diphosphatase